MTAPPSKTPVKGRFARLRLASDRVPTKWFAAILTGLFLAATAAFGGLADAPAAPIAAIEPGTAHTTDQLSITVGKVVLIDDLPELRLTLEPGQRVLAVLADVRNEWTEPQVASGAVGGLRDILRVTAPGLTLARPIEIARVDDAESSPTLQPGLTVPLVFVWAVPTGALKDGTDLQLQLYDQSLYTGTVVTAGQWWDDPTLAATVAARVADVGAGADAEDAP